MAMDSLAIARKGLGKELGALAEEHMKHDLYQSDRDTLRSAAGTVSTYTSAGSLVGLGFGLWLGYRVRRNRAAVFNAFKAAEKPTSVQFAGGRSELLPDLTPFMRPSTFGDIATYTLLGAGGLFFGGEIGLLTGTLSAKKAIMKDRASFARIQRAFSGFQADALRKQADMIERDGMSRI